MLRTGLMILAASLCLMAQSVPCGAAEAPDGRALEQALHALSWEQFRAVVLAVPRLRAEVDAYGPLGWQYVERHYRRHGWRRSLDKLDPEQRRELAALIERVRAASPEVPDQDAEETLKPSRSGI